MHYSLFIQHIEIFIITLIISIIFTLFVYRKTVPAVPLYSKLILAFLRGIAFFLLFIVLFQGQLYYNTKKQLEPVIGIAIDNSKSMSIKDASGDRVSLLEKAANDPVFDQLLNKFKLKYYTFSGDVQPVKENKEIIQDFTGDVTNISKALNYINQDQENNNLSAIVIYTDGNYNQGGSPARFATESSIPVYPVGIGSANPIRDISIDYVQTNPFTYVNEPAEFIITIRTTGFSNLVVPVSLYIDGKSQQTQTLTIPSSPSEVNLEMNYTPEKEGQHKVTVSIPQQSDEFLSQNNTYTIYHEVLKAKQNVTLVAGGPATDISFINRYIQNTDRYQITKLVQKKDGSFYKTEIDVPTLLQETDLFILFNYPVTNSNKSIINQISERLKADKKPIFFISGPNTDFNQLSSLQEFLPFKSPVNKTKFTQISPTLTANGKSHPIMLSTNASGDNYYNWQKLPPAFTDVYITNMWPGTQVLAQAGTGALEQQALPLVLVRNENNHKSEALLAYDTWRWDLMMRGVENDDKVYENFILNSLQWLEVKKETDWLKISTDKKNYNFGDPVHIHVSINNPDAISNYKNEITLQLDHENETEYLQLDPNKENQFTKTIYLDESGDYQLNLETPSLPKDKHNTALFSMGNYNSELANTRLQVSVLKELAAKSGGKFIHPDSLNLLFSEIDGQTREITNTFQVDVWNHKIILITIITLLSLEWFLRKKFGML